MQFLMLLSNIRFTFHENQVSMVEIFKCKGILICDANYVGYPRIGFAFFLIGFAYELVPTLFSLVPSRSRRALSIPLFTFFSSPFLPGEKCKKLLKIA